MFDKYGRMKNEIGLLCFIFGIFIAYHRFFKGSFFIKKQVHYTAVLFELMITWLYLCIPVHMFSNDELSRTTFAIMIITGVLFSIATIFYFEMRQIDQVVENKIEKVYSKAILQASSSNSESSLRS